jgi:phosphatidylglycerophosphatase A
LHIRNLTLARSAIVRGGGKEQGVRKFVTFVATGGYVGFFPIAPGTAGTLVGIFFYFLFSFFPLGLYLLSTASLLVFGGWIAEKAEIVLGEKDSPRIVIDEIIGFLITMILIPFTLGNVIAGFIFFRLFDIIKPPPARKIDRQMKGGFAVVLDDAVAGLYANLSLLLTLQCYPGVVIEIEQWVRRFL